MNIQTFGRRASIKSKIGELSGVNIDEELLKLTQYQRAYEAATRVINVSDELIETILGIVR
jgi:flagellar hook-associated protein 1 FlgK